MQKKKLQVSILLESYQVSAWSYKMIETIQASEYAEIKLVVLNTKTQLRSDSAKKSSLRKALDGLYSKLIERNTYLPNAFANQDCAPLLNGIPELAVSATEDIKDNEFSQQDLETINTYALDVLIDNSSRILSGDVLSCAKYGVWSYHFADAHVNRGHDYGFWESMGGSPATGSMLQILTEEVAGGRVLCKSFSCTDKMSIQDNRSGLAWKSLSFVPRKLSELFEQGEEAFFKNMVENNSLAFFSEKKPAEVGNFQLAKLILSKFIEKINQIVSNKLYFNQWILLFHISDDFSPALWKYKKMVPPKDRFWADPQVVYRDNKYYIFIEELLYKNKRGHISLIVMDEEGNYGEPELILEKPYHLSYPFIFEHEGCDYMIPETMDNNTIDLYKCVEFPNKWEFEMNLMDDVKAVDATVFYHRDKWWMFANMVETDGASSWDELFLFSSDNILSTEWKPHPLNPIVSDCHTSRPAGRIFVENGKIYRPSQNCSERYGYGFNLNEIILLDEERYEERTVSKVEPNWDSSLLGTHTFSRDKALHVIDAVYKRRK